MTRVISSEPRLFERLASETWERLRLSIALGCSQGETTITDHNLLEMKRIGPRNLHVLKATPRRERLFGFDWEWWIRYRSGWMRYAVQAKKLNLRTCRYDQLRHRVGNRFQLDLIERFSRATGAIPLYCFYNYVADECTAESAWNCNLEFEKEQLSCTLAPLHVVQTVHCRYAPKSFTALHMYSEVLPWRCLVGCPHILLSPDQNLLTPEAWTPERYRTLPPYLERAVRDESEDRATVQLPLEYYRLEVGAYPRRILVLDLGLDA